MRSTIDALAAALYHYLAHIPVKMVEFQGHQYPREIREEQLEIIHFRQEWPNTARMFVDENTLAGQAITPAWTTVIQFEGSYGVYCDGQLAYTNSKPDETFLQDLAARRLADTTRARIRYTR